MEGWVDARSRRFNFAKADSGQPVEWEEVCMGHSKVFELVLEATDFLVCQRVTRRSGKEVQQALECGISGWAIPFWE